MSEWITLEEAAEMLGVGGGAELAQELNLHASAKLFKEGKYTRQEIAECIANSRVPVIVIAGASYMFTSTPDTGRVVHPVSHVWREAVFPWAADRAAKLLRSAASYFCSVHGPVADQYVLWSPPKAKKPGPYCGMSPAQRSARITICATPLLSSDLLP